MKYRCHVYAIVRVEHECVADTPQKAARIAADQVSQDAYALFDHEGMGYAEEIQPEVVVDQVNLDSPGRVSVTVNLDETFFVVELLGGDERQFVECYSNTAGLHDTTNINDARRFTSEAEAQHWASRYAAAHKYRVAPYHAVS